MELNKSIKYTIIASLLVLVWLVPDSKLFEGTKSLCLHKALLGIQCPLCGMTRAVHELISFRLYDALRYNLLVLLLPLFFLVEVLIDIFKIEKLVRLRKALVIVSLVGLVLLYLSRLAIYFNLW